MPSVRLAVCYICTYLSDYVGENIGEIIMRQLMKVIGVKVVYVTPDETGGTVEIILAPKEIVKKKPIGVMDLARGNISQIMQEVGSNQKFETKIYMDLNQYLRELKNQPLSDVWLEVTVDKLAGEIVRGQR